MRELKFICETWLPAPDYEESYEVSNFGCVRSIDRISGARRGVVRGQIVTPILDRKGYPKIRLFRGSRRTAKSVHRLVARAFIPNPDNLPQINHIDGNKLNNCVENLEWINNSGNQLHAYSNNLKSSKGIFNGRAKISDEQVTAFKLLYNIGRTTEEAASTIGINIHAARQIVSGRTWKSNTTPLNKRDKRCKPTNYIYE